MARILLFCVLFSFIACESAESNEDTSTTQAEVTEVVNLKNYYFPYQALETPKIYKAVDKNNKLVAVKYIKFEGEEEGIPSSALR